MARKSKGSGAESAIALEGKSFPAEPSDGIRIQLSHAGFPTWFFTIVLSASGNPVGFEVRPKGKRLSRREVMENAKRGRHPFAAPLPEDAPALTARELRAFPLGELQAFAVRDFRKTMEQPWAAERASSGRSHDERFRVWARAAADTPRPGRRGRPDVFYAAVAARYVVLLGTGREVATLADELGYNAESVRGFLYEARRRELLTSAPKGRAGGTLTPKAIALLEEAD